jgi:hypothetical protein
MRDRSLLVVLASVVCCSVAVPGGGGGSISGTVFLDEPGHPVSAALVALYRGGQDTLVDSTYTTDTGRFVLTAPPAAGAFYLVATRDAMTRRQDFRYSPDQGQPHVTIVLRSSSGVWAAIWPFVSKLGFVVSGCFGLVLGWAGKWLMDRQLFRVRLKYLRLILANIEQKYGELRGVCTEMGSYPQPPDLENRYNEVMDSVKSLTEDLEAKLPDGFTIFEMRKAPGVKSYYSLKAQVRTLRRRADLSYTLAFGADKDILLKPFEDLCKSELLMPRPK